MNVTEDPRNVPIIEVTQDDGSVPKGGNWIQPTNKEADNESAQDITNEGVRPYY